MQLIYKLKDHFNRIFFASSRPGLGTFMGVFVPSILMIIGVIIFLRLGWIVGQVGLTAALVIIGIASLTALITVLSMSAIATNAEVGAGGLYYIISRTFGIEIGAATGIPLYIKQSLAIAFCTIGFAESLHEFLPHVSTTSLSVLSLLVLTALAYRSLKGALLIQVVIFLAIVASICSLFAGGTVPELDSEVRLMPLESVGFWGVFAVFFPALTGVESSVSLSGDLRNPARSLPIGTISAILVAYLLYSSIAIFLAAHVPLDRLVQDPMILQNIASSPALIVLGIWGATLSSALGGLLGAPRTLQAMAEDEVVPSFLGRVFGVNREPRIATAVTFLIALAGVYFGSINMIAQMLTMICLICYAVLNLSAGLESLMANPSWRPTLPVHWSISMLGAFLCIVIMLMVDPSIALTTLALVLFLYAFARWRNLQSSWNDIREGILLFFSRFAIYRLAYSTGTSRSWRPHFLVFTKTHEDYASHLLSFSQAISQSRGFLTMASFITDSTSERNKMEELERSVAAGLRKQNIQALVQINPAEKVTTGMQWMLRHYGIGPLVPNTIVFGGVNTTDESKEFTDVVLDAFERRCNIVIVNGKKNSLCTQQSQVGDIHIWWDSRSATNCEFMLVLAYMLQRNAAWRKSTICLKALVADEFDKQETLAELRELLQKRRLHFQVEGFVAHGEALFSMIHRFSSNVGIVFLGLCPPGSTEQTMDYTQYLQRIAKELGDSLPWALVLGSEMTPLQEILG